MGNGLMGELETRLLRGKAALDYEDAGQYSENAEAVKGQTKLEFFMRRKYRLPQRPDVEIERRVWALSSRGKRLTTV